MRPVVPNHEQRMHMLITFPSSTGARLRNNPCGAEVHLHCVFPLPFRSEMNPPEVLWAQGGHAQGADELLVKSGHESVAVCERPKAVLARPGAW